MLDAHQLLWTQIAAGICTLNFAGLLLRLYRLRDETQAARQWDKIEGVIIASEVDQPSHISDDLDDATPVIRYRYRVDGRDLESDRIRVGGVPMTTRLLAIQQTARYPLGAHVDVFVSPKNRKHALLEPGAANNVVGTLVFMLIFGLAAATLIAHSVAGRVLYTANGVPLFAFALPGAAILVAILSVVSFVRAQWLASASRQWPTVTGTITTSDVIEEQIEDDSNKDDSSIRRKIYRYHVDLRYAYRVGQRDYAGTTSTFGWAAVYGLREQAETAASQHKPGEHVTVYYDPEQPGQAVLEPANRAGSFAPLIFSAIFVIGGMLAFFLKVGFDQ